MSKLINVSQSKDSTEFIKQIEGKELIVYEDVQGSKIFVQYNVDNNLFTIKPKSVKNDPLNFVDLSIQKYWNLAYLYFHTLPQYITDILNPNWIFVFEYLPSMETNNIKYNRIPKNNLILTSIIKSGKHVFNYEEILEYSNLFDVDPIPVIFNGKLNTKQLEVLNLYLKTSEEDLKFVFGEESFAKFFYNILNPYVENSFLMENGEFNNNVEKIIIRIDGDTEYSLSILNPLYLKNTEENHTEHSHVFSLIIISFLEFLQLKDIDKIKVSGLTKDELYVNLISILFNDYIYNMKDDINSWEIFVPNFIKDDKFKINIDLIKNKETRELIKSSEKIEYFYKIILGTFRRHKKKPIGIMRESTIEIFNRTVDIISNYIESLININRDYIFQKIDLLNFGEYFNLKFDRDSTGIVYPDINPEFKKEEENQHKKGSGKK